MYVKQLPIKAKHHGCWCCGGTHESLPMDAVIAVGFGSAGVTCDGEHVWHEPVNPKWKELWTVADAEKRAALEPTRDWRIYLHGPLSGAEYQRQGDEHWVLIENDNGFA